MSFSPREHNSFFEAYVECAFWSSTDDDGEPLEGADLADSAHADMREECSDFLNSLLRIDLSLSETDDECATIAALLDEAIAENRYSIERAGHDFWLTRNHHGAGFWDRGLGALGDALTKWSHTFGSRDLYLADDGQVYQG